MNRGDRKHSKQKRCPRSKDAEAATIASAGAAVGIGNVFRSLIHSVARNPSLAKQLFGYAILGFALTEAIALFVLTMAFLISSVFQSSVSFVCCRIGPHIFDCLSRLFEFVDPML